MSLRSILAQEGLIVVAGSNTVTMDSTKPGWSKPHNIPEFALQGNHAWCSLILQMDGDENITYFYAADKTTSAEEAYQVSYSCITDMKSGSRNYRAVLSKVVPSLDLAWGEANKHWQKTKSGPLGTLVQGWKKA